MTNLEIIKLLENEVTCIKRQDGPKCPRFVGMTCAACDLITDTSKVLEALTGAITAIKAQRGGTWKKVNDPEDRLIPVKYYCSACGNWNGYGMAKYCPNCGARVLKPEEKEAEEAAAEALAESHMLDEREASLKGRWKI